MAKKESSLETGEPRPGQFLFQCPDCRSQFDSYQPNCPECGRPLAAEFTGVYRKSIGTFGRVIAVCILAMVFGGLASMIHSLFR